MIYLFIYIYCYNNGNMFWRTCISPTDCVCVNVYYTSVAGAYVNGGSVMRNAYQPSTARQLAAISCYPNNLTGRLRVLILIPDIAVCPLQKGSNQQMDLVDWDYGK